MAQPLRRRQTGKSQRQSESRHERIVVPTLVARVAEALSTAIIEGRLKPGERLIETDLAERFGVSKSPIREAFRLLEQEGLVASYPRRGITVAEIDRRDIEEFYAIRASLCRLQVRLVDANATEAQLKDLGEAFEAMRVAVVRRSVKAYFDANMAFHDRLGEIANNRKLTLMLKMMGKQTLRLRFLSLTLPERLAQSLERHASLLEALKLRDAEAAELAMTELIESTKQVIVDRYLGEGEKAPGEEAGRLASDRGADERPRG